MCAINPCSLAHTTSRCFISEVLLDAWMANTIVWEGRRVRMEEDNPMRDPSHKYWEVNTAHARGCGLPWAYSQPSAFFHPKDRGCHKRSWQVCHKGGWLVWALWGLWPLIWCLTHAVWSIWGQWCCCIRGKSCCKSPPSGLAAAGHVKHPSFAQRLCRKWADRHAQVLTLNAVREVFVSVT